MKRFKIISALAGCAFLAMTARAQVIITNVPLTKIETMEAHTGTVIIKGVSQTGSLTVNASIITVKAKESAEVGTGQKLDAIAIEITEKQESDRVIVDYDELDKLLDGIDYLSKVNYETSPLPSFEAVYTTRAGLRVVAYSSHRSETIRTYLQSANCGRTYLTPQQLAQFLTLVRQAKDNLDSIRGQK